MTTILHAPATLPQGASTPRGVLATATPVPADVDWRSGLHVRLVGCTEPELVAACAIDDPDPSTVSTSRFDPVWVRQSAQCSAMSFPQEDADRAARDRLNATTEWGLGRVLWDGTGVDNDSLSDGTDIGEFGCLADAVAVVEQTVADSGFGGRAYLHAAPLAAAGLRRQKQIDADGLSPAGHRWIISPGYERSAADPLVTVHATGSVWAAAGPMEVLDDPDFRQNSREPWAQRLGIVVADFCVNLFAEAPWSQCGGSS